MNSILALIFFLISIANLALGFYLGSIGFPGLSSADDTGAGFVALFFCIGSLSSIVIAIGTFITIFYHKRTIKNIFYCLSALPLFFYIWVNTPVDWIVPGKVLVVCKYKDSEPQLVGYTYDGHTSSTRLLGPFGLTGSRNFYFLFPENPQGIRRVRIKCDNSECAPLKLSKKQLAEIAASLENCVE